MASKGPIVLWHKPAQQRTDDAGTTILTSICAPPALFDPGTYENTRRDADRDSSALRYVPSLAYFCVKSLLHYPEQIHSFGSPRIAYERPAIPLAYDILRALVPSYDPWPEEGLEDSLDLSKVDPRLWAVIVQVFTDLPDEFRVYPIALSDKHLPLLQHIPQRDDFSLLTILELSHCSHLTDDTILELKALHGLCALDASETPVSAQGILRLSRTLAWADGLNCNAGRRRGPWQLRILRLRNCRNVRDAVFEALPTFPLLSVVDLRGSSCSANTLRFPAGFYTSNEPLLYSPTKIVASLSALASSPNLFSSDNYYALHIHKRHYGGPVIGQTSHTRYPVSLRPRPSVAPEDSYVVLPPSNGKTASIASNSPIVTPAECPPPKRVPKIKTGNAEVLAIREQEREKEHRHFVNSMAWQARRERLEETEHKNSGYASEGPTDTRELFDDPDEIWALDDEDDEDDEAHEDDDANEDDDGEQRHWKSTTFKQPIFRQSPSAARLTASRVEDLPTRLPVSTTHTASYKAKSRPWPDRLASARFFGLNTNTFPSTSPMAAPLPISPAPVTTASLGGAHQSHSSPVAGTASSSSVHRQPAAAASSSRLAVPRAPPAAPPAPPGHGISSGSMPSLNAMDAVASEEVRATVSRQSAEAFYASHVGRIASRRERQYSLVPKVRAPQRKEGAERVAACAQQDARNHKGDETLKLYREPPPWSVLQMPPQSTHKGSSHSALARDGPVAVKRADEQVRRNVEGMKEMLLKRSRTASWEADGFHTKPAPARGPRNPFASQSFGNSGIQATPERNDSVRMAIEKLALPPPGELKNLRPISSIPPPALPAEIKKKLLTPKSQASVRGGGVKMAKPDQGLQRQRSLSNASFSAATGSTPSSSGKKHVTGGFKPTEPASIRKKTSGPGRQKSGKALAASPPKKKECLSKGKGGFDWNSWGAS